MDDTERRRLESLLATANSSDLPSDSRHMKEDLTDVPNLLKAEADDVQIILTRAERRRLAGYVEEFQDAKDEFALEETTNLDEIGSESQRPSKRPRTDSAAVTLVNNETTFEYNLQDVNGMSQDLIVKDFVSTYEPELFEPSNDLLYYMIPAPDLTFDDANFVEESTLASPSVGHYRLVKIFFFSFASNSSNIKLRLLQPLQRTRSLSRLSGSKVLKTRTIVILKMVLVVLRKGRVHCVNLPRSKRVNRQFQTTVDR
jgi:hypothetical protein